MENKDKKVSKKFWGVFVGVCVVLLVFVVVIFVLFANREAEVVDEEELGGNVTLNYTTDAPEYRILNAVPTIDTIPMKSLNDGEYFDFSVDVDLDNATSIEYEIAAVRNDKISTISNEDIKIYLEQEKSGTYTKVFGPDPFVPLKKVSELGTEAGSMVLSHVKRTKSVTDNYRLRMWVSDKSLIPLGNYGVTIAVYGVAK